MIRLRELVLRWQREWLPLDVSHLPATTRVLVFGLMGWSGLALAATLGGVLDIEIAARGLAPVAAKQARAAKLEQSGGEAILQRPLFSRTRQAALPVIARPQPPPLLPPPAPLHALVARDSDMRLRGVFMNAPVVKAFLLSAQNPTGAWVKPDEVFGGWKLVAVRPSDVELEGGGEHLTVALGGDSPGNTSGAGHDKNVVQNFRPNPPFRR